MKHQNLIVWPASFLLSSVGVMVGFTATALADSLEAIAPNISQAPDALQSPNAPQAPNVPQAPNAPQSPNAPSAPLNLTPEVIDQSPVLQRWLQAVPNVQSDIRNDPSFKTRLQVGYSAFPSSSGSDGFAVGIEDFFVGQSPLTISADYQQNFEGDRQAYGADLHYYVLPLGGYINVAPILGYRAVKSTNNATNNININGANLGVRLRFVPSRTGAADITLDQSWVVGDSESLSVTQLNLGYAITDDLRISTDLEWQSSASRGDSRVGINLEWAL